MRAKAEPSGVIHPPRLQRVGIRPAPQIKSQKRKRAKQPGGWRPKDGQPKGDRTAQLLRGLQGALRCGDERKAQRIEQELDRLLDIGGRTT